MPQCWDRCLSRHFVLLLGTESQKAPDSPSVISGALISKRDVTMEAAPTRMTLNLPHELQPALWFGEGPCQHKQDSDTVCRLWLGAQLAACLPLTQLVWMDHKAHSSLGSASPWGQGAQLLPTPPPTPATTTNSKHIPAPHLEAL